MIQIQTFRKNKWTQLLLLSVALLAMVSCSKDDDNMVIPQTVPMATKITTQAFAVGGGSTYTISYDALRRVSKISVSGGTNADYTMTYNEISLLSKVNISSTSPQIIQFGYDANKKLNKLTVNGAVSAVTFNEGTGVYTHASHTFILSDNGDIQNLDGYSYLYNDYDKGAFVHADSNFQLLGIFVDPMLQYVCSKKPISKIISAVVNTYSNEFNAAGYLVKVSNPSAFFTMSFEYSMI